MKIIKNIKVPTGNILVVEGDKGKLECLSIGDYGKDVNMKADFLGLNRDINKVSHTKLLPLEEKWVITISTQYGCSMGCKFCLLEDAPILMSDYTYKQIKDIKLGDSVICNINPKENINSSIKQYATRTTTEGVVTGLIKRSYNGELYKITTEDGNIITCTDEHPIAIKYKSRDLYVPAKSIKIGDEIIVGKHINVENYSNDLWLLGWAYGFILGDGVYDEIDGRRWQVDQNGTKLIEKCKNTLSRNGIHTTNTWLNAVNNYRFAIQGQNVDKLDKIIKKVDSDLNFKNGVISGFWDAEGFSFSNNKCVRVCGTDINTINLIIKFYNDLGYSNYSIYIKEKTENTKTLYILNLKMNRDEFIAKFTPLHEKLRFLHTQKSRSFSTYSKVVNMEKEKYNGIVYNIETSEHNYYAYDILNHNCDVPKVGRGLNATYDDLKNQIVAGLKLHPEVKATKRLNVHYARMGEPTWNYSVVDFTRNMRNELYPYINRSLIHPVVSTMMPKNNIYVDEFINEWLEIKNYYFRGDAGLQLSINSTNEEERKNMFSNNALTLEQVSEMAKYWDDPKGRKYTLNFAIAGYEIDAEKLRDLFNPNKFIVKLTPMHKTNTAIENDIETKGDYTTYYPYQKHEDDLKKVGFDVLVFIASEYEDLGRITCGNAILSGTMPECPYEEII